MISNFNKYYKDKFLLITEKKQYGLTIGKYYPIVSDINSFIINNDSNDGILRVEYLITRNMAIVTDKNKNPLDMISKKQGELIAWIQGKTKEKFLGHSKEHASEYIKKYLKIAQNNFKQDKIKYGPTEKQKRMINLIEAYTDYNFTGNYKKQAIKFIKKHVEEALFNRNK